MVQTFYYSSNFYQTTPFAGVQAGYQFFPNCSNKRFNLFFAYDFNLISGKQNGHYSTNQNSPMGGLENWSKKSDLNDRLFFRKKSVVPEMRFFFF